MDFRALVHVLYIRNLTLARDLSERNTQHMDFRSFGLFGIAAWPL